VTKKVFYSWQSDLPNALNRGFIEKALTAAIGNLSPLQDAHVLTANRPKDKMGIALDQATRGAAGAVHIAHSILEKIRQADVFVADVSTINKGTRKFRKCPNPNVLFELGYAWSTLGENRVLLVFNEATTKAAIDIPFDIRGHKYISYTLSRGSSSEQKKIELNQLRSKLQSEISTILAADSPRPQELEGMSEIEIRRAHDREALAQIFSHINLDVLDSHLHEAPRYRSYGIVVLWDEFDGFFSRSGFHVHDPELSRILSAFAGAWEKSIGRSGDVDYYLEMPDPCKERFMSDHEARRRHCEPDALEAYASMSEGREALVDAMERLLNYTRTYFPEIKYEELGNEVGRLIARRMKGLRNQDHEPGGR
jgi:hypothetical protein